MNVSNDQLIDDYLFDRLNPKERMEFEHNLSNDDALRQKLQLRTALIKGVKSAGRDRLKNRLKKIHQEVNPAPAKTRSLWPRISAIAASVALLIISGLFLFKGNTADPQKLYAQNFEAYPLSLASRDTAADQELVQLNALYKNKEYATALPLFEKVLNRDPNNAQMLLGAGIAHLELGQAEAARKRFAAIIDAGDIRLQDMAHWYTALSFLKENQPEAAKPHLTNLVNNPNADRHQAAQNILRKLNDGK